MRGILAVLFLTLAACGSEPAQAPAAPAADPLAEAATTQQRILALPEPQRLALFANAIRDSGEDCQQTTGASLGGSYQGRPVWQVACRGGGRFTIVVAGDGAVQVLNAAEATLVTDVPVNAQ